MDSGIVCFWKLCQFEKCLTHVSIKLNYLESFLGCFFSLSINWFLRWSFSSLLFDNLRGHETESFQRKHELVWWFMIRNHGFNVPICADIIPHFYFILFIGLVCLNFSSILLSCLSYTYSTRNNSGVFHLKKRKFKIFEVWSLNDEMASISEYIFRVPISLRTCNRQSDNRLRPSRKSGLLFWVALKRAEY